MAHIVHIDRQRHWTGQQARTYQIVRYLAGKGHQVMLVCQPGAEYERRATRDGIRTVAIDMRSHAIWAAIFRLARLLRREHIDLVDAHGSIDHQIAAAAAWFAGRPVIVRSKHKNVPLRSGIFSRLVHRPPVTQKIVAISGAVRQQLLDDGIPERDVELIRTSVDLERFRPGGDRHVFRERFGIGPDDFLIGSASSVRVSKGIDVLVRAVAALHPRHPRLRHVHVGRGNRTRLLEAAERLGLPAGVFQIPGPVQEIESFYAAIDVFCLPSRTEGLGTVTLEAMASGLPVVASRTGGIPEAVEDGVTGFLVPPEDADALAAAIERLIDDRALRLRLGEEGRRRVVERFDIRAMLESTERLYGDLLRSRGRQGNGGGAEAPGHPSSPSSSSSSSVR